MIVGTSQAFLDYDWGNLGHLPHDLTFKKLREKTMESEWSLGHSWLRMSRFSGSAWLHNSGRRFSSPWGTGFLKRASWNLGWHLGSPPCRGRLWGASAIQEPSSSQWRYNMCQLQPTLTLIWKWHEMTQKKTALSGSLLDDHPYPRNAPRAETLGPPAFSDGFGGSVDGCHPAWPCWKNFSRASHELRNWLVDLVEHLPFLSTLIWAPNSTELDFITVCTFSFSTMCGSLFIGLVHCCPMFKLPHHSRGITATAPVSSVSGVKNVLYLL